MKSEQGNGNGKGQGGGNKKKVQAGCKPSFYWEFVRSGLSAAIGDAKGPTTVVMSTNGPVPLAAKAEDVHMIVQECSCPAAGNVSRSAIPPVNALIHYEWLVTLGGGGFVPKTGGRPAKKDSGQQVIYQPPRIREIYPDPRATRIILIQVSSHHRDPSKPPMHGPCVVGLSLTITRRKKDSYVYKWGVVTPVSFSNVINLLQTVGDCTNAFAWLQRSPIQGFVTGPRRCAPGDYVRFEVKANDTDVLLLQCVPGGACEKAAGLSVPMSDTLTYAWMSAKGKFVKTPTSNAGQIVWKAPATVGPVDISVRIGDSRREFVDQQIVIGTRIEVR